MRRALSMLLALALVLLLGGADARPDWEEPCTDCPESTTPCPASCLACPCGRMVSPLPAQAPTLPPAPVHCMPAGWADPLPPLARLHSHDVFQPPRV
jgi:hypothetical protein